MPTFSSIKQAAINKTIEAGITMLAAYNGAQTFVQRVFEDPKSAHQTRLYQSRVAAFDLLWSYYNSSLFDKTYNTITGAPGNYGAQYKQNYNLYRNIRLVYNPVRRLVDFYAGVIYPGMLSEDGLTLPDGVQSAVPFSEDTPDALKVAIAQFWQWTNWQQKKASHVRYGGALGSVLVELVDDVVRGKITADVVWPGFITYLQLDPAGNVKLYVMDYQAYDPVEGPYFYRKIVTQEKLSYYRNYEPYDYDGNGAEQENPYGFVPAVWIKHTDVGGDFGSPAIAGSLGKIDELNSIASHGHDQIHKVIGSPLLIATSGSIANLFKTMDRGATSDFTPQIDDQQSVLMLRAPADTRVQSLAGNLDLVAMSALTDKLLAEIEKDHPELTFYDQLRSMSQVTGPAAARLVGDVAGRVSEAMSNYDMGNISLFRMAVAMAGFRANSGAWGQLSAQQQKFKPFNLDSFEKGDLDMSIMPRALLTPTKKELAEEKMVMWQGVSFANTAGVPLAFVLKDAGYTDEELADFQTQKDAADAQAQAQQDKALQLAQVKAQAQQSPPQADGQHEPPTTNKQQGAKEQAA